MSSLFQVDGIISGLRTADIISQLMALERRPIQALQKKQSSLQQRTDALRDVATCLTTLKSTLETLAKSATFTVKKVSTDIPSTSPAIVTATASASAASGSFKVTVSQLATSTARTSVAAIGQPVDQAATLSQAGFATTPTTGFFTVNGVQITVDESTTLNDGANSIVYKLNNSGAGVTASVVDNRLVLTSSAHAPIQLGSGADTSNFLTVAKLLAAPQVDQGTYYEVTSTGNLGVAQVTAALEAARLATSLSASTGSFKINGVEFAWDAQSDSLNQLISRINASAAGVNAAYDTQTDRLVLTAKSIGSIGIAVEDVAGNFLAAVGVLDPSAQTLGQNAQYSIDTVAGGQSLYSASNTVSGVIPGVTLTLKGVSATPVTVTVEPDTAAVVQSVKAFVDQYNSAVSFIREKTAYNALAKSGGILMGDSGVQAIESRLRFLLFNPVAGMSGGITSLADVGITTGAVGSAPGSSGTLILDEAKFTAALRENPETVARLFAPPESTDDAVATRVKAYLDSLVGTSGTLTLRRSSSQAEIDRLGRQMAVKEDQLVEKERRLIQKFAALEMTLARLQSQSDQLTASLNALMASQNRSS